MPTANIDWKHPRGTGTCARARRTEYPPSAAKQDAVQVSGKAYLLDKFNDDTNLWAGPAKENQEKGRTFAQAKQKADKALEAALSR